jgi:uncharacterized protein (TIGR02246 family)
MRNALFVAVAIAAACAPAAEKQAAAPAAPDSAAARAAVEALSQQYSDRIVAGDAAAVAALFSEDATTSFFGFPTTNGRANIQALYAASIGAAKRTAAKITLGRVNAVAPGLLTAVGTSDESVDSSGVSITSYWRWVAAFRQGADGQWRFAYIMAFPDSTSRK